MPRARSQESSGTDQHMSVIHTPLCSKWDEAKHAVPGTNALEMVPNRTSLLGAAVCGPAGPCGKLGNGVLLVLPVGPDAGNWEVALEGFAHAGPPDIAEHVHKGKVGHHHRFQGAICYEGLQGGPPVSWRLTGAWQIDAPLIHVQRDRSKTVLHQADQALGVRRAQEFGHVGGSGGAVLFCAASAGANARTAGARHGKCRETGL